MKYEDLRQFHTNSRDTFLCSWAPFEVVDSEIIFLREPNGGVAVPFLENMVVAKRKRSQSSYQWRDVFEAD